MLELVTTFPSNYTLLSLKSLVGVSLFQNTKKEKKSGETEKQLKEADKKRSKRVLGLQTTAFECILLSVSSIKTGMKLSISYNNSSRRIKRR